MNTFRFAVMTSILIFCASAEAATPYKEFEAVCLEAFGKSNPEAAKGSAGKEICGCTAKESKSQGVKVSALKRETEKIRQNPKHEIQDERLLAAFQVCTIESMRKWDRQNHSHE